jgi:hypothetical protein
MKYPEFHDWLLKTYGEDHEFIIDDIQQHLGFERKTILNLLASLKDKRLLTRLPQYDCENKRHRKKAMYLVHENEKEDVVGLTDEEHDRWLAMVRKEQQQRERMMSIGYRL